MTPKIVTRLANIAAKLAGSDKYDPTIEPKTAFEYYLDKGVDKILAIKGVPAAEVSDKGKVLSVGDSGAPVWENRDPLIVTFSGTSANDDAACDMTWAQIETAIIGKREIVVRYATSDVDTFYELQKYTSLDSLVGAYLYIGDMNNPSNDYMSIEAGITSDGRVICTYIYSEI